MNIVEKTFIKKLFYKDTFIDFLTNKNRAYILAKQKHADIFVFYKNKKVIILDKRRKYNTCVYNNLDTASKKMVI